MGGFALVLVIVDIELSSAGVINFLGEGAAGDSEIRHGEGALLPLFGVVEPDVVGVPKRLVVW